MVLVMLIIIKYAIVLIVKFLQPQNFIKNNFYVKFGVLVYIAFKSPTPPLQHTNVGVLVSIFYTYIHISIFIHTIIHIHFHLIFSFNNLINLRPAKANKFTHNISLQRHCSRIVFVERRIALSAGIKNDESLFFNHRT